MTEKWGYLQPDPKAPAPHPSFQEDCEDIEGPPQFPADQLNRFLARGGPDSHTSTMDSPEVDVDLAYELRDLRPDDSDEQAFFPAKADKNDTSIRLDDAPGCIFTR